MPGSPGLISSRGWLKNLSVSRWMHVWRISNSSLVKESRVVGSVSNGSHESTNAPMGVESLVISSWLPYII
jgi:hypothetical protein